MKSTRRGFLSLLGGGAVAGPGALKKAMASAGSSSRNALVTAAGGLSGDYNSAGEDKKRLARHILEIISRRGGPTIQFPGQQRYPDLDALQSVSASFKARKTREISMDEELARQLQRFIEEHKLNWVGLDEERLLSIVKQAAGD